MILCSFSGPASSLPPSKRNSVDVLECLRNHPRVSVWDMTELAWLRIAIGTLVRNGLIEDDKTEPYPWIRYRVLTHKEPSHG